MANNPITVPLPQDLPETWATNQIVSPDGVSAGLTPQHGYNYLMKQVNNAQQAAQELGEGIAGLSGDNLPASSDGGETISTALSNKADKGPPQEYDLPLSSGLLNFQPDVSRYWKNQFGEVTVCLSAKSTGTLDEDAVIATLPIGFWPAKALRCSGVCSANGVTRQFSLYIGVHGEIIATFIVGNNKYDGLFAEITFVAAN